MFSILTHWPLLDLKDNDNISVIIYQMVLSLISPTVTDSPDRLIGLQFIDFIDPPFHLKSFASSHLLGRTHAFRVSYLLCPIVFYLRMDRSPFSIPSFPSVTLLDLSTCYVTAGDVHFLLMSFPYLRHLGTLDKADDWGWVRFEHFCFMIKSGSEDKTSVAPLLVTSAHVPASHPEASTTPSIGSPSGVSILP